jgi:hypothetical protein
MKKLLTLCLIVSLIIGTVPMLACGDKPETGLPYGKIVDKFIYAGATPQYKDANNNIVSEEEALQRANTEVIYKRIPLTVEVRNEGADGWLTVHVSCNLNTRGFHQDAQNGYAATGKTDILNFVFWVSLNEWTPYVQADRGIDAFTIQAINVADLAD